MPSTRQQEKNWIPPAVNLLPSIAFAIALRLNFEETEALLKSAGFALSHNNTFDMIIEFFIKNEVYDIFEINAALYQYDQVCLGC